MTQIETETNGRSEDFAAGWRPEAGDKVAGKVIDVSTGEGGYGPYPIVTLEVDGGGEIAIHAFHTVLRGELARRRPGIGDEIGITYHGKRENKNGRGDYHSYRVTGGQAQGYDWSQDLPEDERQAPVGPDVPIDSVSPEPTAGIPAPEDNDSVPF